VLVGMLLDTTPLDGVDDHQSLSFSVALDREGLITQLSGKIRPFLPPVP
jgi:hypothetical protein